MLVNECASLSDKTQTKLNGVEKSASSDKTRWYAIRLLPRQDGLAEANLRRQNICVYIPRILKNIRHARKIETRKTQFFPGYGFVQLDLARQGWRCINGTVGVAHLVMARDRPIPAPVGVIEELRDCSDRDGLVDLTRGMSIGDEVRMRSGPFAGALGLLLDLDEKGRVEVLLQIMNGQIKVSADHAMLEAC